MSTTTGGGWCVKKRSLLTDFRFNASMAAPLTRNRWFLMRHGEVRYNFSAKAPTYAQSIPNTRSIICSSIDEGALCCPTILIFDEGEKIENGLSEKGKEEVRHSAEKFASDLPQSSSPLRYVLNVGAFVSEKDLSQYFYLRILLLSSASNCTNLARSACFKGSPHCSKPCCGY